MYYNTYKYLVEDYIFIIIYDSSLKYVLVKYCINLQYESDLPSSLM